MFYSNNGYSLADIAAATGNGSNRNDNGFGGDGSWLIIILFLFMICGWGDNNGGLFGNGGFGRSGSAVDGYILTSDFANIERKLDGVNTGLCDGFYAMNTGMLNGFAGLQNNLTGEFRGLDNAVCALGYQTQAGINSINVANMQNTNAIQTQISTGICDLGRQLADCCCENRAAIADVKYQMASDTCTLQTSLANAARDITDNQNANTRSILDFLVQDKISSLTAENQSLKFAASQSAQNAYLVNELRPCPIPAYVVQNPYCCTTPAVAPTCGTYGNFLY